MIDVPGAHRYVSPVLSTRNAVPTSVGPVIRPESSLICAVTVVPDRFTPGAKFFAKMTSCTGSLNGMVSLAEPFVGDPSVASSSSFEPVGGPPSSPTIGTSEYVELEAITQPSKMAPNAVVLVYCAVGQAAASLVAPPRAAASAAPARAAAAAPPAPASLPESDPHAAAASARKPRIERLNQERPKPVLVI